MENDAKKIIGIISEKLDVLTPHQISDYTVILAICFGNLGQELADAEMGEAKKWLEIKVHCDTVAETNIRIKATEAYHNKKRLEYAVKGLKETIMALKKRLAMLSDEAHMAY